MSAKTRKPRPNKSATLNGRPGVEEVLTLAEAAAFLKVPETGLKADAVAGKVPGQLVAGEWRFSRPGLLVWLGCGADKDRRSSKERMRALIGVWKDDPTVDAMVEEIYRERQANPVGEPEQ